MTPTEAAALRDEMLEQHSVTGTFHHDMVAGRHRVAFSRGDELDAIGYGVSYDEALANCIATLRDAGLLQP